MKKMIKKVIAPVLVIAVLFAVLRPFCIQDGKCNYLLLLLLMGIGGLIGSVVLLAMIGQAIIYLSVFLLTVITGIHKIPRIK